MNTTPFEIPLSPAAQQFTIDLGSINYKLRVVWNSASACWILDIADANDVPVIQGIPLVTGVDLLEQYEYLGIAGGLMAMTDSNIDAVPTYENLGDASHLYFVMVS